MPGRLFQVLSATACMRELPCIRSHFFFLRQLLKVLMLFLEWFRLDSVRPDNFLWGGPGNKTLKLCDYGPEAQLRRRCDTPRRPVCEHRGLAVMMPPKGKLHGVFGPFLQKTGLVEQRRLGFCLRSDENTHK